MVEPSRVRGLDIIYYSGPDESLFENASSGSPPSGLASYLSLTSTLPLPLPAGGGGARVATLVFCARLRSSDQDGPGPPLGPGHSWNEGFEGR